MSQLAAALQEIERLFERVAELEEKVARLEHPVIVEKRFYTVKDIADRLGVCTKSVRRLIERGLLKKHLGMRHIRVSRESLEYYERHWLSR